MRVYTVLKVEHVQKHYESQILKFTVSEMLLKRHTTGHFTHWFHSILTNVLFLGYQSWEIFSLCTAAKPVVVLSNSLQLLGASTVHSPVLPQNLCLAMLHSLYLTNARTRAQKVCLFPEFVCSLLVQMDPQSCCRHLDKATWWQFLEHSLSLSF